MSLGEMFVSGLSAVWGGGTMFLMVIVAIVLGTIFGALPGVSATMAVALGLTFTYTMGPVPAIVFLTAIYCSSITGGSITAILFKIPGVPSSAPTTFDGYPMAQRGEAGKALGVALLASAIGGLFSALVMFLLSSPLSKAALAFSNGDMFAITFLGLSILVVLDTDHIQRPAGPAAGLHWSGSHGRRCSSDLRSEQPAQRHGDDSGSDRSLRHH